MGDDGSISVQLGGEQVDNRDLRRQTRELYQILTQELGAEATLEEFGEPPPGGKGFPGLAVVAGLGKVAAGPLINAIKKILSRERELSVTITRKSGGDETTVSVTAKNVNDERTIAFIESMLQAAQAPAGG